MSLFWDYFKNTLRLPFIFKPGALAMLAEGGAAVLDTVRDVAVQLRDQFLPARCEDIYLARFARSRGMVRNPLEPDDHWQFRVRFAYNWWIRGGRASAMAEALRIGFSFAEVVVVNLGAAGSLFDESTAAPMIDETTGAPLDYEGTPLWAEFLVIIYLAGNEQLWTVDQVTWAINEIKPARSKLSQIIFVAALYNETTLAGLYDETSGWALTT